MQELNNILLNLPPILTGCIAGLPVQLRSRVVELRLRVNKPLSVLTVDDNFYVDRSGRIVDHIDKAFIIDGKLIEETLLCISGRAIHSKQHELANGYITMPGGNRVGVAGTAVMENGKVIGVKNVTSLNIRVSRNNNLPSAEELREVVSREMFSLLIIGAPRSGKTTILKSVAYMISRSCRQFTVVDTRCEIAPEVSTFFDFCDILSAFPREEGIVNAIKSLAPQIIICDEIGDEADASAIKFALNSGVNLVVTAHAENIRGLYNRPVLSELLELNAFSDVAVMCGASSPGVIKEVVRWNGV